MNIFKLQWICTIGCQKKVRKLSNPLCTPTIFGAPSVVIDIILFKWNATFLMQIFALFHLLYLYLWWWLVNSVMQLIPLSTLLQANRTKTANLACKVTSMISWKHIENFSTLSKSDFICFEVSSPIFHIMSFTVFFLAGIYLILLIICCL